MGKKSDLVVTNHHAKRRVRFVCGSPSNPECTRKALYGTPVTATATATDDTTTVTTVTTNSITAVTPVKPSVKTAVTPAENTTTTNVQIGVLITNIANNKIYYTINTISVTTTVTDNSTDPPTSTIIAIVNGSPYTFPSGYESLSLWYSFINTDTNQNFINNPNASMEIGTSLTVSIGDKFTQDFTGSISGINYQCYFPYWNNSYTGGTYDIFSNNQYVYPPSNTTNVQVDVVINNIDIDNNTIYYTIQAITVFTTVGSSLTVSNQSTYTFPGGYDILTFGYTFTDTNTNILINGDGTMSNSYATNMSNPTSPLSVSIGNTFTQVFTGSLSGINTWECTFPSLNETSTSRTGNIFIYNVLTTNPYSS